MTPTAAVGKIQAAITAGWTTTPIAWPNVDFTPPASGSWLKVDFIWGNSAQMTKRPNARHQVTGVLQLAIFGVKGRADGALDTLAETARAIVNGLRMASPNQDVIFGAVSGPVRGVEESAWRSIILSAPFRVIETIT